MSLLASFDPSSRQHWTELLFLLGPSTAVVAPGWDLSWTAVPNRRPDLQSAGDFDRVLLVDGRGKVALFRKERSRYATSNQCVACIDGNGGENGFIYVDGSSQPLAGQSCPNKTSPNINHVYPC